MLGFAGKGFAALHPHFVNEETEALSTEWPPCLTDCGPGNKNPQIPCHNALFHSTHSSLKLWGNFEPKPQIVLWLLRERCLQTRGKCLRAAACLLVHMDPACLLSVTHPLRQPRPACPQQPTTVSGKGSEPPARANSLNSTEIFTWQWKIRVPRVGRWCSQFLADVGSMPGMR